MITPIYPPLTICVCGAGTMGSGIALTCAQHGFDVVLYDVNHQAVAAAATRIENDLQLLADKNKIPSKMPILDNIRFTSSLGDCAADVIIEAIVENVEAKLALFNALAAVNSPSAVFATNTSSLSVTTIAAHFVRPEQFAGMHFFNPATIMKLVEVVSTKYSSAATVDTLAGLARSIGKTPVLCKDAPGFIVNHVARPYYIEALYLAEKYNAPIESIDRLMEATGFKMGPFRLMDLIGNDINYSVSCMVYEALQRPERLKPSSIQQEKVTSGRLGRKTGSGYYAYNQ